MKKSTKSKYNCFTKIIFLDYQLFFNFSPVQLNTKPKLNKKTENSNTIKTSIKNTSDKENHNFSDSSLELFDTFKPKSKTKINPKQKSNNINFDSSVINISSSSDESFQSFTSLHSNHANTNNISNGINDFVKSSRATKNMNSKENFSCTEESFTKFESKEKNHTVQDHLDKFKSNCTTPTKSDIYTNHLSESAKLLDRIYGKTWRTVDGVLKNSNKELFRNYNE